MKTLGLRHGPRRWILLSTLALATVVGPAKVRAQWVVYDPANHVQNTITALRSVMQVANQVTQIAKQVQQLEYQLQALRKLGAPSWRELPGFMLELDALMRHGEAIAYSTADLNRRLEETFPGFHLPADLNVSRETQRQLDRTLATMHSALLTTSRQMREVNGSLDNLRRIKGQLADIRGHQEALELQITLQAHAAEETLMLRQELAVLNNVLAVAEAREAQQRLQEEAVQQQLLRNTRDRVRSTSQGLTTTWER